MKKNIGLTILALLTINLGILKSANFGFSPQASGVENTIALQKAVDQGGTVVVTDPGTYKIAGTVYVGSNTTLSFGNNVFLKKVNEQGEFSHVFLNKGALTRIYDKNIIIEGLHIIVNGIDKTNGEVKGLRGHLAFYFVKDLKIERFRCLDLLNNQFCIHVCTFEDIIIEDVIIKGMKDGIHLGSGRRFTIRDCVFQTRDDALGFIGKDYSTSNPEIGWIEDGLVENCYDLNQEGVLGFFCRMTAGGWIDWKSGMQVQHSDAVVVDGKIYRVYMEPDGKNYKSLTKPDFEEGTKILDGITWVMMQENLTYTAGVRNVIFRDITLEKPRTAFCFMDVDHRYNRTYYPGAEIPVQQNVTFENIKVKYDDSISIILVRSPVDVFKLINSSLRNNNILFDGTGTIPDYKKTSLNISGCTFYKDGSIDIIKNKIAGKEIVIETWGNVVVGENFTARIINEGGTIDVKSDLPGLR